LKILSSLLHGAMLTGSVTRDYRHLRWCNLWQIL